MHLGTYFGLTKVPARVLSREGPAQAKRTAQASVIFFRATHAAYAPQALLQIETVVECQGLAVGFPKHQGNRLADSAKQRGPSA